jgi:hypothetical protein
MAERACFCPRLDIVGRSAFGFRAVGAVGQWRSSFRSLEQAPERQANARNARDLGFKISVKLRPNTVKGGAASQRNPDEARIFSRTKPEKIKTEAVLPPFLFKVMR